MGKYWYVIFMAMLVSYCKAQGDQIGEYVVETYFDSRGHLWFGTLEKGVARYDGYAIEYFTTKDGLPSDRVVSIIEDLNGTLWLGTGGGLASNNGSTFTNYTSKDGLCSEMISTLAIDRKGRLWIGTWEAVCVPDKGMFMDIALPYPDIETVINEDTQDWTTVIHVDDRGWIWIGRDGYGIALYDDGTITHITNKNGLNSNHVQSMVQDDRGHMWIGTRVVEKDGAKGHQANGHGGLNRYDGEHFDHFPDLAGLFQGDIYEPYRYRYQQIWISTIRHGIYSYDHSGFKNFDIPKAVMSITDDDQGNLWIGCAGGLYRLNEHGVVNVTTNGPWN